MPSHATTHSKSGQGVQSAEGVYRSHPITSYHIANVHSVHRERCELATPFLPGQHCAPVPRVVVVVTATQHQATPGGHYLAYRDICLFNQIGYAFPQISRLITHGHRSKILQTRHVGNTHQHQVTVAVGRAWT